MKKALFLSVSFLLILIKPFAQTANFTSDSPRCTGETMHFTPDPPGGTVLMEVWDFGDGAVVTYLPPEPFPVFATHLYSNPGTFNVSRTVKFTSGTLSFNISVQAVPHPAASFSHSNVTCAGQPVQFTDLSQPNGGGIIQSWAWNFGDPASGVNNTSALQNPAHTFSASGTYNVQLTVVSTNGCSDTYTSTITVNLLPLANFSYAVACEGSPTQFTDLSLANAAMMASYNWSFGDGGSSSQQSPAHTYLTYGLYNTTQTVVNSNGCTHSVTKQVMINPKPVADFFFPAINCMGAPIQFTDMSYIPSGFSGYITTWAWDFGDGTPTLVVNFPGNPSVTHTYSGAATAFVVRLTVTTTSGCSAYKEKVVTTTPSPVANFMAVGATCVSKPVQFTDMSQTNGGGVIVAFNWNFGDPVSGVANTSTAQNPVHIFTGLGVYYVSQTVTNINGCTNTIIKSIQVYPRPYSNFMADTVHVGSPTTFTDLSSSNAGPIINWLWEFGDGQTSLLTNPSYVYPTSGTYMAKLTVTSIYGCNKDTIKPVVVLPAVVTPPVTQTITNVIVGNAQTRCYDATQDITVAGNGTLFYVLAGGNATFIAGQTISYLPGTTIQPDGYMRGYIAPTGPYCPTANMPAVTSNGDEHTQDPGSSLFRIYPNPTRDNFTLELKGELRDNIVTVEIYDTWGIMVLRKTFAGENRFECSLVGLPAGLYFVRVVSGNQIEITKMIKE